jgi:hypothetical protein
VQRAQRAAKRVNCCSPHLVGAVPGYACLLRLVRVSIHKCKVGWVQHRSEISPAHIGISLTLTDRPRLCRESLHIHCQLRSLPAGVRSSLCAAPTAAASSACDQNWRRHPVHPTRTDLIPQQTLYSRATAAEALARLPLPAGVRSSWCAVPQLQPAVLVITTGGPPPHL